MDGWVMVESFDKTWSTGEGISKPLHTVQYEQYEKAKHKGWKNRLEVS